MHDENNGKQCSILPFIPDQPTAPSSDTQQEALDAILREFVSAMTEAEADPNPWRAIKVMVNCEKILDAYTSEGFDSLAEFQQELRADLRKVWRMARRQHIKRALLSPPHEFELYLDDMRHLDGADAIADFHMVESHLDEGQSLFDDLRKQQRAKLS